MPLRIILPRLRLVADVLLDDVAYGSLKSFAFGSEFPNAPTRADAPTATRCATRRHHAIHSITTNSLSPESGGLLMQCREVARMEPRAVVCLAREGNEVAALACLAPRTTLCSCCIDAQPSADGPTALVGVRAALTIVAVGECAVTSACRISRGDRSTRPARPGSPQGERRDGDRQHQHTAENSKDCVSRRESHPHRHQVSDCVNTRNRGLKDLLDDFNL